MDADNNQPPPSVDLGNGTQQYPNGTLITMEFHCKDGDDNWYDNGNKEGVIIRHGRFNFTRDCYDCDYDCDCRCAKGVRCEWKYMVEFDFDKGEDDSDGCESFIELIPESRIKNYLSENNASGIVKKHFGELIKRNFNDAENFEVDWDMFCKDLERKPCIANVNIANEKNYNYFNCSVEDPEYSNLNVLFLMAITGCKDNNLFRKLLTENSSAINYHYIHTEDYWIYGNNFYKHFMTAAPDLFVTIDPVTLRLFLRNTEDKKLICFGGDDPDNIDDFDEDEYDGLCPIIRLLQRQETSTIMRFLQKQENDEGNKAFLIIPQVKVILEESLYAVSKLLGEVYKHGVHHVLLSNGIGSAVSEDVLRFAKVQFESKNTKEIFNSTLFVFSTTDDRDVRCEMTLLGLMFESLNEDNRGSFLWYMNMYMKNRSNHNDSILSLVNSVLDDVLPTSIPLYLDNDIYNNFSYWTNFWSVFKNDEWKNDDNCSVSGQNKDQQHPLLIAIRHEYQYEIIADIVNKDPTILESFDNHENLPPFALVAARRSYNNSNHANCPGYHIYDYTGDEDKPFKKKEQRKAIVCCDCIIEVLWYYYDFDINDEICTNNDLNTTYELLRMNPSVFVSIMMGIDNEKNNSPERVSMNTTNSTLLLSRPHKREEINRRKRGKQVMN